MWLAPDPMLSPDNLRSMERTASARRRPGPGQLAATALESIAPSYMRAERAEGRLDSFRFRAGR